MKNFKKENQIKERDRIKRNLSEILGLISLLILIFIIFTVTTNDCKYGEIKNLKGCYSGKSLNLKGNNQVCVTTGGSKLNNLIIDIRQDPDEYNKSKMEKNKVDAINQINEYKDSGEIVLESVNYYIDNVTGKLVLEGIVANYTDNILTKPKIKSSFYNSENEIIETVIVLLGDTENLDPGMVKEFKVESKTELGRLNLTSGICMNILGKWNEK